VEHQHSPRGTVGDADVDELGLNLHVARLPRRAGPTVQGLPPIDSRTRSFASPLLLLCVAQFVLQLDFSIVNIALRTIAEELHFSEASLQWVVTGYALTFGSLLLLGGRLGDVLGRRRLLLGGLWLFGAASVVCGLAVSPGMLVAARFLQGIGAAFVAPTIIAMLTSIYTDGPARTRALGLWTAATAAGGTAGIVAGGVLTQYLGWRSIFLVNIPVIAILLPAARRVLPELRGDRSRDLDAFGAAAVTIAIAGLIFGLSNGEQHGFGSAASVLAFAIFVLFGVAFVVIERTVAAPMVSFSFLSVGIRRVSFLVMLVVGGVFAAYAYFAALYLQRVLHFSEIEAALALVPAPTTLVIASTLLSRRMIARFGVKVTMIAGLASLAAGQLVLSRLTADSTYLTHVLPGLLLTPFGGALVFPAVSVGMTSRVTRAEQGLAGGLIPTAQQVGAAIGVAVLATIAASTARSNGGSLIDGYRTAYLVAAGLVALTTVLVTASDMALAGEPAVASSPRAP
jgi:EmrB/QacA subfamily drug resistance transporter